MTPEMLARLRPRRDRLLADITKLNEFRATDQPGWTRRAFSPEYLAARRWLRERMEQAGLATSLDAAGNLIGRREGRRDLDPIVICSHLDTAPEGGRFDGTIGMAAGLEIARCLEETGTILEHPLEIVDLLAQHPLESGEKAIGGRMMSDWMVTRKLERPGANGQTLGECIALVGGRPDELRIATREPGSIVVCLELHVEQTQTLTSDGAHIGIVDVRPDTSRDTPYPLLTLLDDAVRDLGLRAQIVSSAPDCAASGSLSVAPSGTLLTATRGGLGDAPEGETALEGIVVGATVLGEALLRIDERVASGERLWYGRGWRVLDQDRTWLGTLIVVGADQPWFFCNFEARPEYEAVRSHFEESIRRLSGPRPDVGNDLWAAISWSYEPIWSLGLRLESSKTAEYYERPMLQIRGWRAKLRGLPTNWDEVKRARAEAARTR